MEKRVDLQYNARHVEFGMSGEQPRCLIVEKGCEREPLTRQILSALPEVPTKATSPGARKQAPVGSWILRRHKGRFLKPCPGTRNYLCCGYHVLNLVLGCPSRCTYCILKYYLGEQGMTLWVNLDDALREIRSFLRDHHGIIRIGTGELADSLALERWVPSSGRLITFFRDQPAAILELKTKSANVDALLDIAHGEHTVISWSLNPRSVIEKFEPGTSSLATRLEAARRCQERGYPIGLHFDPMVWTEHWQDEYYELVREVFEILDSRRVIWISLGALRYPSSLHELLVPSGLGLGELIPGLDGKLRYLRPLRTRMFRNMMKWIRELGGDVFVYLCMESSALWMETMGRAPHDMGALDRLFQERIKAFWQSA
jgi:spore photoproduct lyase